LRPPHSHTLYHTTTNKLGVTLAHVLPRFVRLPVSNTKSSRIKKTMQATFVLESRMMGLVLESCLMLPCLALFVLWSIRTIIEATTERQYLPM
jgi:hypothetical protein